MAVRLLLVLLTLTGLIPAGECTCAACVTARRAAHSGHVDVQPALGAACPAEHGHDHDDSHPIHHHSHCLALDTPLGPLPAPFAGVDLADGAVAAWLSWPSEQTVTARRPRPTPRPSARAVPLYLSQLTLQV